MLAALALGLLALGAAQYQYSAPRDLPSYIKRALSQKNNYRTMPREKKRTITNLTLSEVFQKIKDITRALNQHAKINGYKVDYNLRIFEKKNSKLLKDSKLNE